MKVYLEKFYFPTPDMEWNEIIKANRTNTKQDTKEKYYEKKTSGQDV